ncbi:MAG TPA: hypothetical protein VFB63_09500 [Bryobacteraceae bacterium]|nr:hypothetical protein [Bryobacteraceae bacterium]
MRLALGLLLAGALGAADLSGTWIGRVPGRNNTFTDIAFQLEQSGARLTGKVYGDYRSSPILKGTVAGDLVTFTVATVEQAGNEINDSVVRFTGKLVDGELELSRDRESSTRAGSGGGVQIRPGTARVTFRLKKLM